MSGWGPEQGAWDSVPGPEGGQYPPGGEGGEGYGYPPPPPPPGPGGPYGYGPYTYPGYMPRKTNGLAIASLICSICGFLCLIPAVLGVIFGFVSLAQIKREGAYGRGMAIAGAVIGILWLVGFGALILFDTSS